MRSSAAHVQMFLRGVCGSGKGVVPSSTAELWNFVVFDKLTHFFFIAEYVTVFRASLSLSFTLSCIDMHQSEG